MGENGGTFMVKGGISYPQPLFLQQKSGKFRLLSLNKAKDIKLYHKHTKIKAEVKIEYTRRLIAW